MARHQFAFAPGMLILSFAHCCTIPSVEISRPSHSKNFRTYTSNVWTIGHIH
jgi:hypothetical protein